MATLEDKILGEKLHYYCSSSESEHESDNEEKKDLSYVTNQGLPSYDNWQGSSSNTGPKGVIKDWQRFKQLDTERRKEQEKEKIELAKKLTLTCRSHLDDEKAKEKNENEEDVDALLGEEILQQYILQRMNEMLSVTSKKKKFGELLAIHSGEEFLEVVDKEDKNITVVVHIYENSISGCDRMNECLIQLAVEYPEVKFCCFKASKAGLSKRFRDTGVPALLIYKTGQMVANFVRLMDELEEDFSSTDLASFLEEHGILPDKSLQLIEGKVVRESSETNQSDSE